MIRFTKVDKERYDGNFILKHSKYDGDVGYVLYSL